MLVIKRKIGERFVISLGDHRVVVTVVDRKRDHICLGVDAPKEVTILREEQIIQTSGRMAS